MENAAKILSEAVHGLDDAKMQILQMTGQLIANPKSIGCAIGIYGPPGTGKTSLIKDGIAKILGVNQQSGLIYLNDKKPFELIINNNEETLKQIVKAMI